MFREAPVRDAMASVDFERVRRLVYRHPRDFADVNHFLYFNVWGTPKEYLAAVYGLGNLQADNYATRCLLKYGGRVYERWKRNRAEEAVTRISFGRLAGWRPRDSIHVQQVTDDILTRKIAASVNAHLVPLCKKVRTRADLLTLLTSDAEPVSWALTNGAARAAQIAYLALNLGESAVTVRKRLRCFDRYVAAQLTGELDAGEFIERVIRDCMQNQ